MSFTNYKKTTKKIFIILAGCPASYQQKYEKKLRQFAEKKMTYLLKKSGDVQFSTQNQVKSKKNSTRPQKNESGQPATCIITSKRVTSGGIRLQGLAPGQHSFKETPQQWQVVGDIEFDSTNPGFESHTHRTNSNVFTSELTGRLK